MAISQVSPKFLIFTIFAALAIMIVAEDKNCLKANRQICTRCFAGSIRRDCKWAMRKINNQKSFAGADVVKFVTDHVLNKNDLTICLGLAEAINNDDDCEAPMDVQKLRAYGLIYALEDAMRWVYFDSPSFRGNGLSGFSLTSKHLEDEPLTLTKLETSWRLANALIRLQFHESTCIVRKISFPWSAGFVVIC